MPKGGKLSKKEQARLARLELWEEGRRKEREGAENEESAGRDTIQLQEQLAWAELRCQRWVEYADPQNQLSVSMASHKCQMLEWDAQREDLTERLHETRTLLQHTAAAKECLEDELRDIRSFKRTERAELQRRITALERAVQGRLDEVISSTMTDIAEERLKAQALWNQDIESTRLSYLRSLRDIRSRVGRLTEQLQESKALHSNLPTRIRLLLSQMDVAQLLTIVDTLSFEPEVLQFFMFRFPPESDLPYGAAAHRAHEEEEDEVGSPESPLQVQRPPAPQRKKDGAGLPELKNADLPWQQRPSTAP